jgi:hypothetical protein
MVLIQVGFGNTYDKLDYGMCEFASFAVLVNGEATDFFRSGRGLRQGCPCHHYFLFW